MRLALEKARASGAAGEVPVGALVVAPDGRILACCGNAPISGNDPTAHAEVLALRDAAAALGRWRLDDATLVVTLEPCAMCAGAAVSARLGRLVFGAPDLKAGATGSLYNLCADPRLNHEVQVTHGIRAAESTALLQRFFAERR